MTTPTSGGNVGIVGSIALLRGLSAAGLPNIIYVQGAVTPLDGGQGFYAVNLIDKTSTDSGYEVIVDAAGYRWWLIGDTINAGSATVNFGAFPGASDTLTTITNQPAILATSSINTGLQLTATADHSADEHWVDGPQVFAGNIVPGVGFTIYARTRSQVYSQHDPQFVGPGLGPYFPNSQAASGPNASPLTYGAWTVQWEWR